MTSRLQYVACHLLTCPYHHDPLLPLSSLATGWPWPGCSPRLKTTLPLAGMPWTSYSLMPERLTASVLPARRAQGNPLSSTSWRVIIAIPVDGAAPCRVAIVAVDPTSPFTGGAILGDRVRMRDLAGDPGVFIRSMASRGSLGGLAAATTAVVQVFDAAGFDVILIETVGAGQAEVDIARLAHTTLVVEAPGLGDDIQAIKAGILEIADVLVVNKADQPGAEVTERILRNMLELAHPVDGERFWLPPILSTVATDGRGVPDLAAAIASSPRISPANWRLARTRAFFTASRVGNDLARHARIPLAGWYLRRRISPHPYRAGGEADFSIPGGRKVIIMIYGDRIRLRADERADLPRFVEWLNDPEVREGISYYLPLSPGRWRNSGLKICSNCHATSSPWRSKSAPRMAAGS